MKQRTFYKTKFIVTIVSEKEPSGNLTLEDIHHQMCEGDWSGEFEKMPSVKLTAAEAAEELIKQGSDPSFFNLDENGNELDGC